MSEKTGNASVPEHQHKDFHADQNPEFRSIKTCSRRIRKPLCYKASRRKKLDFKVLLSDTF